MASNFERVHSIHQAYPGRDVFVIGAGASVGCFESILDAFLRNEVTIGVNRTAYVVQSTFLISAYLSELLLGRVRSPRSLAIHCRPELYEPDDQSFVSLRREFKDSFEELNSSLDLSNPRLITRNNVFFLASHFAAILGAQRIIYIGFDMDNKLHFYENREDLKEAMFHDFVSLKSEWHRFGQDHPYETPFLFIKRLFADPQTLQAEPFYIWDHAPFIGKLKLRLAELGIEMISCVKGGVLERAGVPFKSLRDIVVERAASIGVKPGSNIAGYVDRIALHAQTLSLEGWIGDLANPHSTMTVIVEYEGEVLQTVQANQARPDVLAAYGWSDQVRPGFMIECPWFAGRTDRIRVYGATSLGQFSLDLPLAGNPGAVQSQ